MTFSKLGKDTETHQPIYLPKASRTKGVYILGLQGSGKSGLIENLCIEDGKQGTGFCVIDPHGELIDNVISRIPANREHDVILFDIRDYQYPFGLNLFACSDPTNPLLVQEVVDQVMHIFEKLYDVSRQTPRMAQFLRNCTYTLVAHPGYTMADIPLLLQDEQSRRKLVANVTDPQVRLFWKTFDALKPSEQFDRAESTINKMDEFLQPLPRNIVGQAHTTVDIQQVMDERKILLVKLDSLRLPSVTKLIGALIIALFLNAAYSRTNIPINKRKQFNLYADEFQRFATEDFATLLTEARKFGIATTIAHQARYQPGMTDGIRAVSLQSANFVMFRVTSPDADELAGSFDITPQEAWEEELEEERVEVLKEEWYEKVEQEVIDGEEPIQTISQDPIGHLLRHGHRDKAIRDFVQKVLKELEHDIDQLTEETADYHCGEDSEFYNDENTYASSRKMLKDAKHQINQYFVGMMEKKIQLYSKEAFGQIYQILLRLRAWIGFAPGVDIEYIGRHADVLFTPIHFDDRTKSTVEEYLAYFTLFIQKAYHEEKVAKKLEEAVLEARKHITVARYLYAEQQVTPELLNETTGETRYPFLIKRATEEVQQIVSFIDLFAQIGSALAQEPIMENSGNYQPRKRKQINYLTHPRETITHPRVAITHPQRTYQDVINDIANQLSSMPNFAARVKLSEIAPQNPGKKCLKCKLLNRHGAKYCMGCGKQLPAQNEYTIETIKPAGYMGSQQLQQRMQGIQTRNRQQLYCRSKKDVEDEIIKRQQTCSGGSAPAQAQQPQQQPQQPSPHQSKHARQVLVQGKCPKCGKNNPTGSKFCNQCGSPL